ncbi:MULTISPECIES: diacylglycerol kinase family protein [unclassified Devosia]|uniref:diacylglycerol/lipid kinase family protein n=1 Tax=unclassified Devosia TaxID=196773 RepID=UPI000FDA5AE4|nr:MULTISPECIES: diacylglycerol kinase family protein [unclassified Devosia]
MRIIAVLNRDGGTLRTMDLDAFSTEAISIFAEHGHSLECRVVGGKAVQGELWRVAETPGVDVIMAAGGDGTVSAAAGVAFATKVPLAVLPAGTMNLFARSLKVPQDLHEALEALAAGTIGQVDVCSANDRAFVYQFNVGVHARLVRIREDMVYRSRLGKIFASLRAVAATVVRPPNFEVDLHTPTGSQRRRASGIVVSNNPIGSGPLPHPDQLDAGLLAVYVAEPMSSWALLKLVVDVFRGTWQSSPLVTSTLVEEAVLHFPKRKRGAHAVIDGELIRLDKLVKLRVHPGGLPVLLPQPAMQVPE